MTQTTHRDLYAASFAERIQATLDRLQAAKTVVAQRFPNLTLPAATRGMDVKDFAQREQAWDIRMASTVRLRALVMLATAGGKDPITVTVEDVELLVSLSDLLNAFEEAMAGHHTTLAKA